MPIHRVDEWLDSVSGIEFVWYLKRLAANDTLATNAHQAGPYVSKDLGKLLFPTIFDSTALNPEARFPVLVESHEFAPREVRAVWYNNKRVTPTGTRDEFRITNWGGRASALLAPESTGALAIFAFLPSVGTVERARVWVCRNPEEEDAVEARLGAIEPKQSMIFRPATGDDLLERPDRTAGPLRYEIPAAWRTEFPAAEAIVDFAISQASGPLSWTADKRLLTRRGREFDVFRTIEESIVLPRIREGFHSVDEFIGYAGTVANRRKSRSGRSLELHLKRIFTEERIPFAHGSVSEGAKRPDFLFPSAYHYRNHAFPADKLRMLAVKTTCKDRWRQILNEADRIPHKHLFTLQEGVSENQFEEMVAERVQLVIPATYRNQYPKALRAKLQTLGEFIEECRSLYRDMPIVE